MRLFASILSVVALACALALLSTSVTLADVFGTVRGTTVDQSGKPLAGVAVTLKSEDSGSFTTTSGSDGSFEFPHVPFDTYTITATANDGRTATDTVTVSSGSTATIKLALMSRVLGHVTVRGQAASQPVSVNVLSSRTISTLPGNTSLSKVVETAPGIVPFSYDEPVSRGYHGISYEVDGVPLPQPTTAQFSEIIDPRDVDRLEIFTGAIPAEFGGEREGAVVDIITSRLPSGADHGSLSLSTGSYGYGALSLDETAGSGPFRVFVSANEERTNRGLDAPTFDPIHDSSNQGDEFMRTVYAPDARDSYAVDFSNQYSGFQIPIDTNPLDPNDPCWSPPSTDDNQHEYDRSANVVFNRQTSDGKGYFEFAPWYRSVRVTYLPDLANDLAGGCPASTFQDRFANYVGGTTSWFRTIGNNNVKVGATADVENFKSAFSIALPMQPTFLDNVAQRGSNLGVFAQDKFDPSENVSIDAGVRYDHSTGFISGDQISPRLEISDKVNDKDTLDAYYGRLYAAPGLEDVRRDAVVVGGGGGSLPVYDLKPENDSVYQLGLAHRFSPYANIATTLWFRSVANVLDTTQLGGTPIFTLFNSAIGRAEGVELHAAGAVGERGDNWFLSYGLSQSLAKGISGGTFLFNPQALQGANDFALEDHDQTNTLNAAYTWVFAPQRYATLQTLWGSGFPAQFENGTGRLPGHVELGASVGIHPPPDGNGFGWEIAGTNILGKQYLLKLNNGFNTTQYAAGSQITFKLIAPIR